MTKKTRLIILLICALFFLVIAPPIVLYSLGYRIDFEQKKIVATGGIYIKAWPQPAEFYVDSKLGGKTNMFSDSVFVQNLLPKKHNILIKKEGYFSYQKTLDIKEKEVVKIEHVILFKENIPFDLLENAENSPFKEKELDELFFIKNGNLYKNDISNKPLLILKNLLAFKKTENNIIWLGVDGFLYSSDVAGQADQKLSSLPLKINKKNSYKIEMVFENIFLFENDKLLIFSQKTKELQSFYDPVKNIVISPDGQKILFYNDYEIFFSFIWQLQGYENPEKIFLNRFSEKINECLWLNNDYVIFTIGGKIKISETDNKNNLNIVSLPEKIIISNGTIINLAENYLAGEGDIKGDPKIYFNQQDKKLYIHTGDKIVVSEKILP
jgi:hypothetical protein